MLWWLVVGLAILLIGVTKSGFGSGAGLMIPPMTALAMSRIPGHGEPRSPRPAPAPAHRRRPHRPLAISPPSLLQRHRALAPGHRPRRRRRLPPAQLAHRPVQARGRSPRQTSTSGPSRVSGRIALLSHFHTRASSPLPPQLAPRPARASSPASAPPSPTPAGPIIALHLLPQRFDRRAGRRLRLYFAILNAAKLPAYAGSGMFTPACHGARRQIPSPRPRRRRHGPLAQPQDDRPSLLARRLRRRPPPRHYLLALGLVQLDYQWHFLQSANGHQ